MLGNLTNLFAQGINDELAGPGYYYTNSEPEASGAAFALMGIFWLFYIAVIVISLVSMWKIFVKAGKPGWAAIVPVYNNIVLLEIVNRPAWWIVLFFVPFVNFVVVLLTSIDLARAFGKSDAYAALLVLLPLIGYPMLAFDKNAHFRGVVPAPAAAAVPVAPAETPIDDTQTPPPPTAS